MNRTYPHIARTTALALLVALGTACGNDSPIAPAPTPGSGTPVDIGRLEIASTPDAASPATRVSINSLWQNGDAVIVSATKAGADAGADKQNATYIYNESSKSWALKSGDTHLYVEQISPSGISIETWGGYTDDGLAADQTLYTDQSDPATPASASGYTSGDRYRRNDHLLCSDASLSGRTLNGKLAHLRVDFVLQITDGTDTDRLNILPTDAVLTLNADGTTQQQKIIAYREQKTAEGTTTFRAHLKLADVPGISLDPNGTATGTVSPASLLGTLTYTMGSTPKTLKIRYSITSTTDAGGTGTSSNNIPIVAGKRIVVSATFADLSYLDATATLTPWKDIDGWHAGTEDISMIENGTGANGQPIYEIYAAQGMKRFADLVNGTGEYTGKQNTGANVKLMADIDLSSVCGEEIGDWTPIGIMYSNPYTGCFDGQGHTVSGLYIKQDKLGSIAGLFGWIRKDEKNHAGSILHLRVEIKEISISSDNGFIGILAAANYGTITDCYVSGNVSGGDKTGGLVGYNVGGTIMACHATGSVSGTYSVGGLVGYNDGSITACYATGNVSGNNDIGGLVGDNFIGTITACYAIGNVSGKSVIGGLVGSNQLGGSIIACYATGSVTGTSDSGGLVGNLYSPLLYCATTHPTLYGNFSGTAAITGSEANVAKFSDIRNIVASDEAQNEWKYGIKNDFTIVPYDLLTPDLRVLNGPWEPEPGGHGTANAIWKSAVNAIAPGEIGSLHLWWQP